jgi:hypothetical protein
MDSSCLEHPLTEEETLRFKQDGYLIVKDVLPADRVSDLVTTVDRVDAEERARMGHKPDAYSFMDTLIAGCVPEMICRLRIISTAATPSTNNFWALVIQVVAVSPLRPPMMCHSKLGFRKMNI